MRTRDAMLSHCIEARLGSGSDSQRTGPTTWPVGARRIGIEVNIAGGGAIQVLDSEVDYRDRWILIDGNLINEAWYGIFGGTIALPRPTGTPGLVDIFNYPYDKGAVTFEDIAVLKSEIYYSALGWDGSTLPRGVNPNQNFAQFKQYKSELFLNMYLYADNFTGGLTLRNFTAQRYQGFLVVEPWEQLGARVIIP